ncbi:MAG: RluA family pseudouridine synthase [Planctomycetes bacterium]|nr:RluA family pseudouridine synthase [Planctomycetota bacterium]
MAADPRDGTFRAEAGGRLDRALKAGRPGCSWNDVRDLIARGKVAVGGARITDPGHELAPGAEVTIAMDQPRLPPATAVPPFDRGRVLHQDRDLIVVDKPAGLPTVPWGDEQDTLDRRLQALLDQPVRTVHRLDRDTSGAIVFARTKAAFTHLEHQLRRHAVHRRYLAVAHGEVHGGTIRTFLADDRGDGLRGSIANEKVGKEAITHVERVELLRGASLVRCRLETGRTHQIRIHLAESGHMLLGERGYVRDHRGPVLPAPRILLHAAELGFVHPLSDAPLRFSVPMPDDMAQVVAALRR